ncbi:ACP S-malonyltransferase [Nocardia sp. NPDC058633]|uniref:ACP S-malonyltransferase n=1 Tax=Nocardia sp. NPDC058633 TaxID=3346568 RepID=UPI0036582AEA
MTTAFIFPGMGPASFDEVGRFMVANPIARELVQVADETLGYSLVDAFRLAEGDYSHPAQIAFLINCLASAQWAVDRLGIEPDICVGPSFGGKAALAFAGVLSVPDAVCLTARLAVCMDDYFAEEHTDIVTHSFVRVPADKLADLRAELDALGAWNEISCYVDDGFFMLSLSESRVEWLQQRLRAVGGMSLYTMRPPMHCPQFAGLRDRVADEVLPTLDFADPRLPVMADQDGAVLRTGAQVAQMLLDGIVRPLRWPEVVTSLHSWGVRTVCVAGPDSLFGRVACTTNSFDVIPANPRLAMMPVRRSGAYFDK